MSSSFKFWMMLFGGVVVLYVAYHLLIHLIGAIISLVVPLVVIGGIGYVVYLMINKKALNGGRRILP